MNKGFLNYLCTVLKEKQSYEKIKWSNDSRTTTESTGKVNRIG